MDPRQREPGPDHPITITPFPGHVVIRAAGHILADTQRALRLQEASYSPVYYIPLEDVDSALLQRTDHHTFCPYKGDCSYFTIQGGAANAVWAYENPFPAVAAIAGHVAFYPDRVEAIEIQ